MKRRTDKPSTCNFVIRCTQGERSLWHRLAKHRERSLAELIRAGLAAAAKTVCLCRPGEPICPHCQEKQS